MEELKKDKYVLEPWQRIDWMTARRAFCGDTPLGTIAYTTPSSALAGDEGFGYIILKDGSGLPKFIKESGLKSREDAEKKCDALLSFLGWEPKALHSLKPYIQIDHKIEVLNALMTECFENSVRHGFWTDDPIENRKDIFKQAAMLALIGSEVSEAVEALRIGNPRDEKIPSYSQVELELADIIIRTFDFAKSQGMDLASAIISKMAYNTGRPVKHGKLF